MRSYTIFQTKLHSADSACSDGVALLHIWIVFPYNILNALQIHIYSNLFSPSLFLFMPWDHYNFYSLTFWIVKVKLVLSLFDLCGQQQQQIIKHTHNLCNLVGQKFHTKGFILKQFFLKKTILFIHLHM